MLGAAHSCANPLTARYNMAHGVAVGLMLPHVVRFNATQCNPLYFDLLVRGGLHPDSEQSAGEFLAHWVSGRLESHGLPSRLSEVGVSAEDIPGLASEASNEWTAQFNPRPVAVQDFMSLYEAAF
jgi:alcohol dehydrogenase